MQSVQKQNTIRYLINRKPDVTYLKFRLGNQKLFLFVVEKKLAIFFRNWSIRNFLIVRVENLNLILCGIYTFRSAFILHFLLLFLSRSIQSTSYMSVAFPIWKVQRMRSTFLVPIAHLRVWMMKLPCPDDELIGEMWSRWHQVASVATPSIKMDRLHQRV